MEDTEKKYRHIRQSAVDRLGELQAVPALTSLFSTLDDWAMKMRVSGRLKEIGTPEAIAAVEEWKRKQQ